MEVETSLFRRENTPDVSAYSGLNFVSPGKTVFTHVFSPAGAGRQTPRGTEYLHGHLPRP